MKGNRDNVILEKVFSFAVRIVNICRYLMEEGKEFVLSKQLLKSGNPKNFSSIVKTSQKNNAK